jgi:uncharacterized membrane protein YhhN
VEPLPAALLAVAAIAAVVTWAAIWSDRPLARAVEAVGKPTVILALIAAVLTWPAGADGGNDVRPWLLAALVASLAGDVLLLSPTRFVAGLVAFLLAHLAYLGAFAQLPGTLAWLVAGIAVATFLAVTVGRALVAAARPAGLGVPVGAYVVAILAMAVAATRTGLPAAILGAWLFVASDAMLGWGRFRTPASDGGRGARGLRMAVIITYHTGQLLLVLALVG